MNSNPRLLATVINAQNVTFMTPGHARSSNACEVPLDENQVTRIEVRSPEK